MLHYILIFLIYAGFLVIVFELKNGYRADKNTVNWPPAVFFGGIYFILLHRISSSSAGSRAPDSDRGMHMHGYHDRRTCIQAAQGNRLAGGSDHRYRSIIFSAEQCSSDLGQRSEGIHFSGYGSSRIEAV